MPRKTAAPFAGPVAGGLRERIAAARRAQLVAHYEEHGWPIDLVRLLNARPLMTLAEALDGLAAPTTKEAA